MTSPVCPARGSPSIKKRIGNTSPTKGGRPSVEDNNDFGTGRKGPGGFLISRKTPKAREAISRAKATKLCSLLELSGDRDTDLKKQTAVQKRGTTKQAVPQPSKRGGAVGKTRTGTTKGPKQSSRVTNQQRSATNQKKPNLADGAHTYGRKAGTYPTVSVDKVHSNDSSNRSVHSDHSSCSATTVTTTNVDKTTTTNGEQDTPKQIEQRTSRWGRRDERESSNKTNVAVTTQSKRGRNQRTSGGGSAVSKPRARKVSRRSTSSSFSASRRDDKGPGGYRACNGKIYYLENLC